MHCYARLLANYPVVIIASVFTVSSICIIISFTLYDLPSFQDPQLGFETRGTVLAQRSTAWENLMEASKTSGPLTTNPLSYKQADAFHRSFNLLNRATRHKGDDLNDTLQFTHSYTGRPNRIITGDDFRNRSTSKLERRHEIAENEKWKILEKLGEGKFQPSEGAYINSADSDFFCGEPTASHARIIFKSLTADNLFTLESFQSMCNIENSQLRTNAEFSELCEVKSFNQEECCRSWSLSNYALLLSNKSTCDELSREDVDAFLTLLQSCAKFYYSLQLKPDCYGGLYYCHGVPHKCIRYNIVYISLHYLADRFFLNPDDVNGVHLTYAMTFLPIACSSKALPYFKVLEEKELRDETTEIVAMELGLKYILFDEFLIHDTVFIGVAAGIIFLLMWMYTTSFFITLMTLIAIGLSVGIAYFMYIVVFNFKFFPFMNLLTAIIIIGIGADDAFIYCKVWCCAKSEKNNGKLVKLVNDTLKHATLSMFVTSLTTAAAFYASYISNITAIRCFCLFAATTVLCNFLLMLTWLPATIVITEKWCSSNCCICIPPFGLYSPYLQHYPKCAKICNNLWKLHYHFSEWSRIFFEKFLPCIVIKPRYIWLTFLGSVAICGAITIFYYPKLNLPDSTEFQILSANHPFEVYDLTLKDMFWFEKIQKINKMLKLPMQFVWGIEPIDNGDYDNPRDKGTLQFDTSFNVAQPKSQEWLLYFCRQLRNQSFYESTRGPLLPNCFIERFKEWMERRCFDSITEIDRSPCCENSTFPYTEDVFDKCIHLAVKALYETPAFFNFPGVAGPRFSKETGKITAVVIEYDSIYSFSMSYDEMHNFFSSVEDWLQKMLHTAPAGMKNGWFISYLNFYDLQQNLLFGTIIAILVAMGISFAVLFLSTLNILISFYAIVTIVSIIFVTVGILILLDWKMNIVESITATIAIGLAVDFTLHYGILYKLSVEEDRESRVIFSLSRMGSPITMAAFTTMIAGACMMPSSVLAYAQVGTFIMVIMTVSWIYGTFFFQSLLRLAGPQKTFGQFHYPSISCCPSLNVHVDKTICNSALSESTLSSSSTSYPIQLVNESHELEPLTSAKEDVETVAPIYKQKYPSKSSRQRSGSLSVTFCEKEATILSRKVSLPTGALDKSSKETSTTSSTIVFSDDTHEQTPSTNADIPDIWVKNIRRI